MKDTLKSIGRSFYLFRDEFQNENGDVGRIIIQCGLEGGVSIWNDGLWRYSLNVDGVDEI